MFDLESEYGKLIDKHFITSNIDKCKACKLECFIKTLNTFFDDISIDKKVALYGLGFVAKYLLKYLSSDNFEKIAFYSDNKANNGSYMFNKFNVLTPEQLLTEEPDVVIITPFDNSTKIKESLIEIGFDKNVLKILPKLVRNTIAKSLTNNLCPYFVAQAIAAKTYALTTSYTNTMLLLNAYESAKNTENKRVKKQALGNLVFAYLSIRDIIYAEKYMHEYIDNDFDCMDAFKEFLVELNDLMNLAKENCKENRSVIITLIDGLVQYEVDKIPILADLREKSYCIENSYTQYCWTTSSFQTMFTGGDLLSDKVYDIKKFNQDNSPVLRILNENNKPLYYVSVAREVLFEEENKDFDISFCMTAQLFKVLHLLSGGCEKTIMMHFLEFHELWCGISKCVLRHDLVISDKLDKFYYSVGTFEVIRYMNESLGYYFSLFGDNVTKITMSDHGNMRDDNTNYFETPDLLNKGKSAKYTNTVLFLNSNSIMPKYVNGLFSYKDFAKFLEFVFGKCDDSDLFRQFLRIYQLPAYSWEVIIKYEDYDLPVPKLGLVSEYGVYWIDYNGVEEFYPNDCIDIDKAIKYSRELCGIDFKDLLEQEKFLMAKKALIKAGKIKG